MTTCTSIFTATHTKTKVAVAVVGLSMVLLVGCASAQDNNDVPASDQDTQSSSASATKSSAPSQGQEYVTKAVESGYALNSADDLPVVTMYTDYECPACQAAHPLVERAAEKVDGRVTVMVKNFPLSSHENAVPAARAVEAAGMQEKAHDFASYLYENPDSWAQLDGQELDEYFVTVAQELKLDEEQFKGDYSSDAVANIVSSHRQQGQDLDLRGTPSFVANDTVIDMAQVRTAEDLASAFEEAAGESGR